MGWNVNDLTVRAQAPLAVFRPSGYVYGGQGTQHVVYEGFTPGGGADGHVHELWWDGGWHHHDLTHATGAPLIGAGSMPVGYDFNQADTIYGTQHVTYVGADGHVHELWDDADSGDGWQHHDLTSAAHAPPAINVTAGYGWNGIQRVFYEGQDLHVHVLTWSVGSWTHYDVSAVTGAPVAGGPPGAYPFFEQGSEHALYVGTDGHVHELWVMPGPGWHHNDLTLAAGAPLASDTPSGFALLGNSLQHVGYRGVDGHVHELWWLNGVWRHRDLNAIVSAPPAAPAIAGPIAAWTLDWDQSLHFAYTGPEGYIRELWFKGQDWHLNDLSIATGCPLALGPPSGYAFTNNPANVHTQHVVYVDERHHVIELWWTP